MLLAFSKTEVNRFNRSSGLSETLIALGQSKPKHFLEDTSAALAATGKALLIDGRAVGPDGKLGPYISKYYNCLSCHNQVKEDPDVRVSDPTTRLAFAVKNQIPFLQGTTFKGIVSRESWYNGDYEKKYGELVEPARNDLGEAIQLCATQCAQGRLLEDWELKAILAYFWTIDYNLGELDLSEGELEQMNGMAGRGRTTQALDLLRTKYLKASPATFGDLPLSFKDGYKLEGDKDNGKYIFELSCLHCHRPNGESNTVFANDFTWGFLENSFYNSKFHSFYPLIRNGTYAMPGHRPYMPNYSLERMSNQQVEDLRAYISYKANS